MAQGPEFIGLGDLPEGLVFSSARGISADGLVVVGESEALAGREVFRWTKAGGLVSIGELPGGKVIATGSGVSGDGSVIAGQGAVAVAPPVIPLVTATDASSIISITA